MSAKTIACIEAAVLGNHQPDLKPEWLSVANACRVSDLGRTTLYELINSGAVKSACIRQRGAIRGRRLVSYDSLMSYIESCVQVSN